MFQEVWLFSKLFAKEEFKNKNGLYSILLYVISSIYTVYLAVQDIENGSIWISLFWIIQTFACLNAATKSFQYSKGRDLYLYQLGAPKSFILAKIIYNWFLLLIVFYLSFLVYSLMLGSPFENQTKFLVSGSLGVLALSSLLTMMAAITYTANNNYTLMAILSLPIMIPLLIVIIKVSNQILGGYGWNEISQQLYILLGLNVMIVILSYILFPYLCKD